MADAPGPATITRSLPPATGTVVGGRYTLVRELGRGGMGRVYEARDGQADRRVALKVMRGSRREDAKSIERFRREAQVLSAIDHPNVAAVHDFGEDGETLYLVMELVDGPTVSELVRQRGPFDAEAAAPLVAGVCAGLGAAHARGVIHRDLKPGNVVLTGGDLARPKLVDFGVARAAWLPSLTLSGTTVGTPRFMAPEQLGGTHDLDARADVYGAGLLIYFLLAGRDPFPVRNDEALLSILTGRGAPLGRVRPEVPVPVEAVVHQAIAHIREARHPTAAALADAYAAALRAPRRDRPVEVETVPLRAEGPGRVSVILVRPRRPVETTVADRAAQIARSHGVELAPVTDGLLLCSRSSEEPEAIDAAAAARCARELMQLLPDTQMAVVVGEDGARPLETRRPDRIVRPQPAAALDARPGATRGERGIPAVTLGVLLVGAVAAVATVVAIVGWPDGDREATEATPPLPQLAPAIEPVDPVELSGPAVTHPQPAPAPEPRGTARRRSPGAGPAPGGPEPVGAAGDEPPSPQPVVPVERVPVRGAALLLQVTAAEGASIADVRAAIMTRERTLRACADRAEPDRQPPYTIGVFTHNAGGPFVARPLGGDLQVYECVVRVLDAVAVPGATSWVARFELR